MAAWANIQGEKVGFYGVLTGGLDAGSRVAVAQIRASSWLARVSVTQRGVAWCRGELGAGVGVVRDAAVQSPGTGSWLEEQGALRGSCRH